MSRPCLLVRRLGLCPYEPTWHAMQAFTDIRTPDVPSELWLVEHPPVFTQGQAGKAEHLLDPGDIPVVHTDRGGQVTYHGPGQLVVYLLIELRETGLGIRGLVNAMENSVIELLSTHGVPASARREAPGVYVKDQKIASVGLRVKRGLTYHGLALNVSNDLSPFARINPCGFADLAVTRTCDLGIGAGVAEIGDELCLHLADRLGYSISEVPAGSGQPGIAPTKPPDF